MVSRRAVVAGVVALSLTAGCRGRATGTVNPADYDSFFVWAGVRPQAVLGQAKTLYVLGGEVRRGDPIRLVQLGPGPPQLGPAQVWLVIRTERLDWDEAIYTAILSGLTNWQANGIQLVGLQIDFDAATKGLENYAAFLADLRHRLPRPYKLSITGLMDWSANGDPAALVSLQGVIDEVVVQTYQGRTTIPGYARYLERLARVPVPHKVALVQGGEWTEPRALRRDPGFRGYVVFLLNPGRGR